MSSSPRTVVLYVHAAMYVTSSKSSSQLLAKCGFCVVITEVKKVWYSSSINQPSM